MRRLRRVRGHLPEQRDFCGVTEFLLDNLLLLPFLFVTYLVLEILEARAGGALERSLGRTRRLGPLFGAFTAMLHTSGPT